MHLEDYARIRWNSIPSRAGAVADGKLLPRYRKNINALFVDIEQRIKIHAWASSRIKMQMHCNLDILRSVTIFLDSGFRCRKFFVQ